MNLLIIKNSYIIRLQINYYTINKFINYNVFPLLLLEYQFKCSTEIKFIIYMKLIKNLKFCVTLSLKQLFTVGILSSGHALFVY